jgi:hypothetical protein
MVRLCSFGSEGIVGAGAQALGTHEAGNSVLRTRVAAVAPFDGEARATVGASVAMAMDGFHGMDEVLVFLVRSARCPTGGGMVAAPGDIEGGAEFSNGKGLPHGVDQRIPLCGSSESMLMAFF